jgi:hypothetical protein
MNFRLIQRDSIVEGSAYYEYLKKNLEAYTAYLTAIKEHLPPTVYDFATAPWHYDPVDPRSPHDARIKKVEIHNLESGARSGNSAMWIQMVLLGAYHDRLLRLTYFEVNSHSIDAMKPSYGDWITDEIRLSGEGFLIHEIEFADANLKTNAGIFALKKS